MSQRDSRKIFLPEIEEQRDRITQLENPAGPIPENPDAGEEVAPEAGAGAGEATPEATEDVPENANEATPVSKKPVLEDGFVTPTSSVHRIPASAECPPAPRKTRPQSSGLKRKASPARARRSLEFDAAADEAESIFRSLAEESVEEQKTKKARRDDTA